MLYLLRAGREESRELRFPSRICDTLIHMHVQAATLWPNTALQPEQRSCRRMFCGSLLYKEE